MKFPAKVIRAQLARMQDHLAQETIAQERKAQERVGAILQQRGVHFSTVAFPGFSASLAMPEELVGPGAVLYLHGGGYCCGGASYARGFGSQLAALTGLPVLCPAYRLAPEAPFPAALQDALCCYQRLLAHFAPEKLVLAGESAGGGLLFSLCLLAKRHGLPLPGGLVAISPWADLTDSGASFAENAAYDPSLNKEKLDHYAQLYASDLRDPLVSPLFGDLAGLPESLLFVGGDEILRDDAVRLHAALERAGCRSTLTIAPGMWHAYLLYQLQEAQPDLDAAAAFIRRIAQ